MNKNEDFLRLDIQEWSQYWKGGNVKYPPIGVLNIEKELMDQLAKLDLLDAILRERQAMCEFLTQPLENKRQCGEPSERMAHRPSSFHPAATPVDVGEGERAESMVVGEDGPDGIPVIFIVSSAELKNYMDGCTVKHVYAVGYDGFGIGCGRAAAVQMLARWRSPGLITDDRTQGVTLEEVPVEDAQGYGNLIARSGGSAKGFVCSVGPKLNSNILTIVRADRPFVTPLNKVFCFNFSPLFISSKEDMSLARIMDVFANKLAPKGQDSLGFRKGWNDLFDVVVHTDTNNPKYENKDVIYTGKKERVLKELCSSPLFRDAEGNQIDASVWRKAYKFLNLWDVIKMQESALYQLIESIGEEPVDPNMADDERKAIADVWKEILPYFQVALR